MRPPRALCGGGGGGLADCAGLGSLYLILRRIENKRRLQAEAPGSHGAYPREAGGPGQPAPRSAQVWVDFETCATTQRGAALALALVKRGGMLPSVLLLDGNMNAQRGVKSAACAGCAAIE
jgi:hypothetical protein